MEKENEELKLDLLPATGLLELEELAGFLKVNKTVVRENFKKQGIPMLTYKRGHSIISLDAITEKMKRNAGQTKILEKEKE